jgi:hypothetical protein
MIQRYPKKPDNAEGRNIKINFSGPVRKAFGSLADVAEKSAYISSEIHSILRDWEMGRATRARYLDFFSFDCGGICRTYSGYKRSRCAGDDERAVPGNARERVYCFFVISSTEVASASSNFCLAESGNFLTRLSKALSINEIVVGSTTRSNIL